MLTLAAVLAASSRALAQQPEGAADPLDGVRSLVAFVEENDKTIDDWLDAQIAALKAGAADEKTQTEADQAAKDFRGAVLAQHRHQGNSREFSSHLAERYFTKAATELSASEPLGRRVAWPIARVMLDLAEIKAIPAIDAGLENPDASVRLMSVIAYSKLKTAIGSDANLTRSVLQKLREFGEQDHNISSGVMIGAVYDAMSYTSGEQVSDAVDAIAGLMQARAKKRNDGELATSDRGDFAALQFVYEMRDRLTQASKVAFVKVLAAMLVWELDRHSATVDAEKAIVQEKITYIEQLLADLTGAPAEEAGNIRGVLEGTSAAPDNAMKIELFKWVGSESKPGVLNAEPWNVPVGGVP